MLAFSELLSQPEFIDESTKVVNALLDYVTKLERKLFTGDHGLAYS